MNASQRRAKARQRAVDEARERGRTVRRPPTLRTAPAPSSSRPCSVEFAKELRQSGASGALISRALGLEPLRRRRSVVAIARRYFPAVAYGVMIGIGLLLAAAAWVATP